jgi:hypothetical protein
MRLTCYFSVYGKVIRARLQAGAFFGERALLKDEVS